jgi:DNA-binding transcriptional MerR regulator
MTTTYTLDQLCALTDMTKRTVRYYMQLGLVDRPIGETRAAHYTSLHLEQLLQIRKLADAGVSLERIREVLAGGESPVPDRVRQPGAISVLSHVFIAPGVELQIDPQAAGLSPEQLRAFVRTVMTEWEKTNAQ